MANGIAFLLQSFLAFYIHQLWLLQFLPLYISHPSFPHKEMEAPKSSGLFLKVR